jgi:hypothetical protein
MTDPTWPFPGARRFDFHTPASRDTDWFRVDLDLLPRDWLRKYMEAGIDCVAVTDKAPTQVVAQGRNAEGIPGPCGST